MRDLQTTLRKAREDSPDDALAWLLTEAPGPHDQNTGWANVQVRFPKTDHTARENTARSLAASGLSYAAIGRILHVDRSWVSRVVSEKPDRAKLSQPDTNF